MASVRRSPHPWPALLVIIAASTLVTAGASANEAGCKGGFAVFPGVAGTVCATPSTDSSGLGNGRSAVWSARNPRVGFNTFDCDDRFDGDDDKDVPEKEWSRDVVHFGHDLIPVDNDCRPGFVDTLSIPSSSFQRLRC